MFWLYEIEIFKTKVKTHFRCHWPGACQNTRTFSGWRPNSELLWGWLWENINPRTLSQPPNRNLEFVLQLAKSYGTPLWSSISQKCQSLFLLASQIERCTEFRLDSGCMSAMISDTKCFQCPLHTEAQPIVLMAEATYSSVWQPNILLPACRELCSKSRLDLRELVSTIAVSSSWIMMPAVEHEQDYNATTHHVCRWFGWWTQA